MEQIANVDEVRVETPIGPIGLITLNGCISRLIWQSDGPLASSLPSSTLLAKAGSQLEAYFRQQLTEFDLPLNPEGSGFQKRVYQAMVDIPYGETATYGELAEQVGGSAQSVGSACGANPIPIIIPCHRVVSAKGLGGYSGDGGIETKIKLLRMEGAIPYLI